MTYCDPLLKTNEEKNSMLIFAFDVSDDPLVMLGKRIGVETLSVVFDELAGAIGMSVYVPTEVNFYNDIERTERRIDVWETWDLTPYGQQALASKWGVSTKTIRRDFSAIEKDDENEK